MAVFRTIAARPAADTGKPHHVCVFGRTFEHGLEGHRTAFGLLQTSVFVGGCGTLSGEHTYQWRHHGCGFARLVEEYAVALQRERPLHQTVEAGPTGSGACLRRCLRHRVRRREAACHRRYRQGERRERRRGHGCRWQIQNQGSPGTDAGFQLCRHEDRREKLHGAQPHGCLHGGQ